MVEIGNLSFPFVGQNNPQINIFDNFLIKSHFKIWLREILKYNISILFMIFFWYNKTQKITQFSVFPEPSLLIFIFRSLTIHSLHCPWMILILVVYHSGNYSTISLHSTGTYHIKYKVNKKIPPEFPFWGSIHLLCM